MKARRPTASFASQEFRRFVFPLTTASIVVFLGIAANHVLISSARNTPLLVLIGSAVMYIAFNSIMIARTENYNSRFGWLNSILSGAGLGLLCYFLPETLQEASHMLIVLGVVAVATVSGRAQAYTTLLLSLLISLPDKHRQLPVMEGVLEFLVPFIISAIVSESFFMIKDTTRQNIHRLETINRVSREIMLSLDTGETIALLDKAIKNTLEADTYFIGIVRNGEIHLDLFFDDGEYFKGMSVPIEGTLAGWVIKNKKELFLPDLRNDVYLEGVERFIVGRERTSLSWMGVSMNSSNVNGVIGLASYRPNAFDQADMELLSNLAQHITLALENSVRHAQVEEQARLDSMTGVYNHGYYLKRLTEQAEDALAANLPLSLIMLDIDHFKQYNDTYGHLVGDQILNSLCTAIKQNIKHVDAVGRWGGEEFVISLPGATGEQAMQVAQRVSETMMALRVEDRDQRTVPVPTVSQGIAVFPHEADEIYRLIDLADRRLYIAKERGRNQIEPDASHWQKN